MIMDSEKFRIISQLYNEKFVNATHFGKLIGVSRSTVYNWLKPFNGTSINIKSKIKICNIFELLDTVWSDEFYSKKEFRRRLKDYKKIESKTVIREKNILIGTENEMNSSVSIEDIPTDEVNNLLDNRLESKTSSFKFAFAKLLKDNGRVIEALKVLDWIESDNSSFKYIYENQIKHLKAILLSHSKIVNWDGAIDILRSLYHSSRYHLVEPEIITLLASNYKRKSLDGANSKDEINLEFITSALCLYEDAYNLKSDNSKYYDAINMAYLYKIVDAIEVEYANRVDIETLYRDLNRVWRKDISNWWEVSSNAEFLMLLGEVDLALSFIYDFLENYEVKPFEIDATFRQLNLYIKYTDDRNAKEFLDNLQVRKTIK